MTISASTQIEIRATGSDTNGGGYVSGGTDWSLQDSPQYSVADGVTNGTTTITSASASFGTDVVGNLISVAGGTGSVAQNWYQIISRTNATTIVVDRATGLTAGTGVTLKIGGALASIGGLGAMLVALGTNWVSGLTAHIKSATTLTSTTANVSGGKLDLSVANLSGKRISINGYAATRLDDGTPPTIDVGSQSSFIVIKTQGYFGNLLQLIRNVKIDGKGNASVVGFDASGGYLGVDALYKCTAVSCTTGFQGAQVCRVRCAADSCTTGIKDGSNIGCEATGCTTGFLFSSPVGTSVIRCLARGNSSHGFDFSNQYNITAVNNTSVANGGDGFKSSSYDIILCHANVAANNTGWGFNFTSGSRGMLALNNATYSNTAGAYSNVFLNGIGAIVPTGDPFVSAGSPNYDYRPDLTAGEGATLKASLSTCPSQAANLDVGAVQHSDPSGGSTPQSAHGFII